MMAAATIQTTEEDRFIRIGEVVALCGVSRTTVYRWIDEGEFPKQKKLGKRTAAWRLSDITAWMESKEAA